MDDPKQIIVTDAVTKQERVGGVLLVPPFSSTLGCRVDEVIIGVAPSDWTEKFYDWFVDEVASRVRPGGTITNGPIRPA